MYETLLTLPDQHAGLYLIQLGYKIFVYSVKLRKYLPFTNSL